MRRISRLTIFLCCTWAASLLYGEMIAYWIPRWTCSWPHQMSSSSRLNNKKNGDRQINIVVLADPQVMDWTSLRLSSKSVALRTAQFYTDLYMKRSFISSVLPFKPDRIVFLGDQFDGGPFLSDEEWQESLNRFKHIFYQGKQGRSSYAEVYYLSGNHDIGYASFLTHHPEVVSRFEKEFGKRNYVFTVGKVDFIVVDAQTLDGPTTGNLTLLTWNFIKSISKDPASSYRVLLTHIPLYRPDGMDCGSYRTSPIINQRISHSGSDKGIRYQNYLTAETSKQLLEFVKPMLVLSGHDHDQCTVTHSTSFGPVAEHTLGTVSWQQGNLYPSFMLLSVSAPTSLNVTIQGHHVSVNICFLPWQTHIYIWYLFLFVFTLFLLLCWPTSGSRCWDQLAQTIGSFLATAKEKDEDENYDYEMVWDAEGSMHLVRKAASKVPATSSSDSGLMARGNVIARPAAKKQVVQDIQASIMLDMNADARSETQTGKSMDRRIVQRLTRASWQLLIIAIFNVPLYIMLLFKDWVEVAS